MPYNRKIIFLAALGNILEHYDFALYGAFVPIIAPLFFPARDRLTSILITLGVVAAGFFSRPLGAILFGHIGDKRGRKYALTLSIFGMALPTLCIGLLPTYEQIGIFAPLTLTVCRVLQGISTGGESSGAAIFVLEHMAKNRFGLHSGIMSATAVIGVIFATLVAAVMSSASMPSWAWRLPFILGAFVGIGGFYARRSFQESPQFKSVHQSRNIEKIPLWQILRENKKSLFCTIGISWLAGTLQLTLAGYINIYLNTVMGMNYSEIMLLNAGVLGLYILFLPLAGLLADYTKETTVMTVAAVIVIVSAYPIYGMLSSRHLLQVFMAQLWLALLTALYGGPKNSCLFKLFATNRRYSGMSLGHAIGSALFGGTTPVLCTFFIKQTGDIHAPAFYLIIGGIIGSLSTFWARFLQAQDVSLSPSGLGALKKTAVTLNEEEQRSGS